MTDKLNMFIPIQKINAERHEIYGWGAIEEVDNSDEILDYMSSKPLFLDWSNKAQKRSGGKSFGNVRSMHQNVAAGKLIALKADDVNKGFYVGAKIVDDNEWKKVEQGVYTGFSIGGSYAKRWSDFQNPGKIRYTAKPAELSIVDSPCIPSATFQMVKADGVTVTRSFKPTVGVNLISVVRDNMIKVVGGGALAKADWEENKHPRDDDGKFESGGGGGGSGSKKEPRERTNRSIGLYPREQKAPPELSFKERVARMQSHGEDFPSSQKEAREQDRRAADANPYGDNPKMRQRADAGTADKVRDLMASQKKPKQASPKGEDINRRETEHEPGELPGIRTKIPRGMKREQIKSKDRTGYYYEIDPNADVLTDKSYPSFEAHGKIENNEFHIIHSRDFRTRVFATEKPDKTWEVRTEKKEKGEAGLNKEPTIVTKKFDTKDKAIDYAETSSGNKFIDNPKNTPKITKGDIMSKLQNIYTTLEKVENELAAEDELSEEETPEFSEEEIPSEDAVPEEEADKADELPEDDGTLDEGEGELNDSEAKPVDEEDAYEPTPEEEVVKVIRKTIIDLADILETSERRLVKQDVPGAPESIADIPLAGKIGPAYNVEQMPPPNVLLEIKPNAEPSQDILANHAVMSKDLTAAFNAWLPKVGVLVKSMVASAVAEALDDLGKTANSAPVQISSAKNARIIKVRKEQ